MKIQKMYTILELQDMFISHLRDNPFEKEPKNLYTPVNYILQLGGKRIRPVLVLAGLNLYQDDITAGLQAALSVEMFHNFTLLHDDIMDKAPLRRGQQTVHEKYGTNEAILSGDVMMIMSHSLLNGYESEQYTTLSQILNSNAILICEGQQMDIDFESAENVTISDYIRMIELKTAVLLGASLQMGGVIGEASESDQNHLFEYGRNMGIAFQLMDDLLDTYGDAESFGKQVGGDIIQGKKTYLYLKTIELLEDKDETQFRKIYYQTDLSDQSKIDMAKQFFRDVNVSEYTNQLIEAYSVLASSHLDQLSIADDKKTILREFTKTLLERKN